MTGKHRARSTVTQQVIADELGIAVQTVSAVLGGRQDKYRREMVERVRTVAARLGYRPHQFACATRTGRTGFIGLLHEPDSRLTSLPQPFIDGLHRACADHDLSLRLVHLSDGKPPDGFDARLYDGLLINRHIHITDEIVAACSASGLPLVWINADRPMAAVLPDDHGGGFLATTQLLASGHRRIAYLDGTSQTLIHVSVPRRLAGHQAAMNSAGLVVRHLQAPREADSWQPWYRDLLSGPQRPTAVVCNSSDLARLVGMAVIGLGLRIPEDLSLVAFADINARTLVPVSFARVPWQDVGVKGCSMLMDMIMGSPPPPQLLVPFSFIDEGSVGASPGEVASGRR